MWYKEVELEFDRISGAQDSRSRDALFPNLQDLIAELRKAKSFHDRKSAEIRVVAYLVDLRRWAAQNGFEMPNLEGIDLAPFEELEGLFNRSQLGHLVHESEEMVNRLVDAQEWIVLLSKAYDALLHDDKRTNPEQRDNLLSSLRPVILEEFRRITASKGGMSSRPFTQYVLGAPSELEAEIKPLVDSTSKGDGFQTSLVPVNSVAIEKYVRNFLSLKCLWILVKKRKESEERGLQQLRAELAARGGPLSLGEHERLEAYLRGEDTQLNIARYFAALDTVRFLAEERLRRAGR